MMKLVSACPQTWASSSRDDAEAGDRYSVAAVLGGDSVAEESGVGEDAHQLRRDAAGLVHLGGDGGDFVLGEGADLVAEVLLLGG